MKDIIVKEILLPSLSKLYEVDYNNINFGVSERNSATIKTIYGYGRLKSS